MNIMYFIPSLATSGGMERVLTEKVNYLAGLGLYKIFIVTTEMSEQDIPFFKLDKSVELINLKINFNHVFNENFTIKFIETKKLLKKYKVIVEKIIINNGIDICITMGGKELEFIGDLKLECKIIYELHFNKNFRSSFLKANFKNNVFWSVVGKLRDLQHIHQANKVDKIVVLTDENLKKWKNTKNGVIKIVNPSSIKNLTCSKPKLNVKRVIAIGKLDHQKGFDFLIDAWSMVYQKHPDWRLDIFGVGELEKKLQDQITKNNLSKVIKLAGITTDVMNELLESSFLVLSSRFEGLPMVLIESITCGLPVVAFDCETGPSEIITSNDCGLLIPNSNTLALAEGIICLIENPLQLSNMSERAIIKSNNYHLEHVMEKWIALFNELLSEDATNI